jgi:PqqD family protein of HPr-rel-A system
MNRLGQLALSEEGFIFDPMSGQSFQVNATGIAIFKALRENPRPPEIAVMLTETYDVLPEEADRDVSDFVERLRAYGLM